MEIVRRIFGIPLALVTVIAFDCYFMYVDRNTVTYLFIGSNSGLVPGIYMGILLCYKIFKNRGWDN